MSFVELLGPHHDRASFDCGKEPLNRFIALIFRPESPATARLRRVDGGTLKSGSPCGVRALRGGGLFS